jgi:hypothetical protein
LVASSDAAAQASCLIRSCNDVRASTVTGVTGVTGVDGTSFREDIAAMSAPELVCSAGGFGMSRSTLSGLKGNNPAAAHPARMVLAVIALSLAGL